MACKSSVAASAAQHDGLERLAVCGHRAEAEAARAALFDLGGAGEVAIWRGENRESRSRKDASGVARG
jgi:hypothetical protein